MCSNFMTETWSIFKTFSLCVCVCVCGGGGEWSVGLGEIVCLHNKL
jgi:hypothetical protein